MKHSTSKNIFFFSSQPWLYGVSLKGTKMKREVTSKKIFFFKRLTCKKRKCLKKIIFQNKARQQSMRSMGNTQGAYCKIVKSSPLLFHCARVVFAVPVQLSVARVIGSSMYLAGQLLPSRLF